jgi:hypothetical protein
MMDQIVDYLSDYAVSFTCSDLPAVGQPANGPGHGVPGAHRGIGRLENVQRYGAWPGHGAISPSDDGGASLTD